jgi:hypothetical protein
MEKPISLGVRRGLALAVCIAATIAAPTAATQAVASAEPDHTATLNRANPKLTWESSGSGAPDDSSGITFGQAPPSRCTGAPFRCEYVLLHVQTSGELALTLDNTAVIDPSNPSCLGSECSLVHDIDGRLYWSNAAGEPLGNTLTKDCVTGSSSETCKVAVGPGFYVVEVEYYRAVETHYIGTAELVAAAPGPPAAVPQIVTVEGCNFTLYYFKDSAERLQALVPPGYRVRPQASYLEPLENREGTSMLAAAAYDCDRIEVPGKSPAPGIFTVLSVLVQGPVDTGGFGGPADSDYYVLWIHANNPQLVHLLKSRGMPAHLVPGMRFEKPLQSLGVRVEVPWSPSAYELAANGFLQDVFHSHDNTYWHEAANGRPVRMDFVTRRARDQFCFQPDQGTVPCAKLKAQAGTPVANFFGASDRTAHHVWDHDPLERSWFFLQ